jgi:flagellar assembly protein FliH
MSLSRKSTTIFIGHAVQTLQRADGTQGTISSANAAQPTVITPKAAPALPSESSTQAFKREYERGVAAGKEQAQREFAAAVQAMKVATQHLQAQTQEFQKHLDNHGVTLAMSIAAKIIGREVNDARTVQHMIAQTLTQVPMKRGLKIRLNPADAAMMQEMREKHAPSVVIVPDDAEFVADAAISKGGCVIDSMLGRVDARIETQLELLDRALTDRTDGATPTNA